MIINATLHAKAGNYGGLRNASAIRYIVLHYTANKNDTARNNCQYFHNNKVSASAHYFVDDDPVAYQSVKDTEVAYSVGGAKYPDTKGGLYYGKVTNSNSISIEMCSTNGKIAQATFNNAVELTKTLMKKYNIPASNVVRHFDVNGKPCPGWAGWIYPYEPIWDTFKRAIENKQTVTMIYQVICDTLNVRSGAGTTYPITMKVHKNEKYTIVDIKNNWGKLKSGAGWISLNPSYVKRVQ